ncbi:hypothetical protein [Brevundimonas subvibrioides]|uniref:hypothetical protein n=1 Tax=Brevundimonas subvibrioides TaxID=74313 RepID=UPI0032D5B034
MVILVRDRQKNRRGAMGRGEGRSGDLQETTDGIDDRARQRRRAFRAKETGKPAVPMAFPRLFHSALES